HKVKLAMKIGGEYKLAQIGSRQWQKFARKARVDADHLIVRLTSMAKQIPDEVRSASARAREEGPDASPVGPPGSALWGRARPWEKALGGTEGQAEEGTEAEVLAEGPAAKRGDRAS